MLAAQLYQSLTGQAKEVLFFSPTGFFEDS